MDKEVRGISKEEFCRYLRETLIPDLKESGREYTAEDFETALNFMEGADRVVRHWERDRDAS